MKKIIEKEVKNFFKIVVTKMINEERAKSLFKIFKKLKENETIELENSFFIQREKLENNKGMIVIKDIENNKTIKVFIKDFILKFEME